MRLAFLFGQVPFQFITSLRVAIGSVVLLSLLNDLFYIPLYYSDQGIVQGNTKLFRVDHRFSLLDYFSSPSEVMTLYVALCIFLIFLIVGIFPRVFAALSFILLSSFHEANPLILNSGDTLMRVLLFLLIFVGYKSDPKTKTVDIWPIRLIQFQLCLVYLFAFFSKTGETYKNGQALYFFLGNDYFARFDFLPLESLGPLLMALTWLSLLIEAVFAFLVWFPKLRPYVNGAGIALQMGILITVNITFFSLIMLATHLSFVDPKWLTEKVENGRKRINRFKKRL